MNQMKMARDYIRRMANATPNFESIFNIMFTHDDYPLFEFEENGVRYADSYPEIREWVLNEAAAFQAAHPEVKGEFIAIDMDNRSEWIVSLWAILASGNKPYLLNSRHPKNLTEANLRTLGVKWCFSIKDHNDYGLGIHKVVRGREIRPEGTVFSWADEIALGTSGTSLHEKICLYSGKEILAQLLNTDQILKDSREIRRTDSKGHIRLLAFLPFYHIFGLIAVYFWFALFGYTIVFLQEFSPDYIMRTIREFHITHIFAVPLFWHTIEANIRKEIESRDEKTRAKFEKGLKKLTKLQDRFPRFGKWLAKKAFHEIHEKLFGDDINFLISGGSYLKQSALELFNGIGYPLYGGYGASEIGITSVELSNRPKNRNKNGVGKPLPSVTYRIVDGTLEVKGTSSCHSIIIDGVRTEVDGWFKTLDLCSVDEDGRYYISGRQGDLIIGENGENINPDILEQAFDFASYPSVLNFSVLGLREADGSERCALILQVKPDLDERENESLQAYIQEVNRSFPSPQRIRVMRLTSNPIMPEGGIKTTRPYLKRGIQNGTIELLSFEDFSRRNNKEAYSALLKDIIQVFAETLSLNPNSIHADSNFGTDLGGTSLDYYTLLTNLEAKLGKTLVIEPESPLLTPRAFEEYLSRS